MVRLFDRYPVHFTIITTLHARRNKETRNQNSGRTIRGNLRKTFWRAWVFYVTNHTNMNLGNHVGSIGSCFFPTAAEAAYPYVLCQRMASSCLDEAKAREVSPCETLQEQLSLDLGTGEAEFVCSTKPRQQTQTDSWRIRQHNSSSSAFRIPKSG